MDGLRGCGVCMTLDSAFEVAANREKTIVDVFPPARSCP